MNNFIVGISTGNKDVKMSAGEIECSVLNFDFIKQCNNHGAQAVSYTHLTLPTIYSV